MFRIEVRDKSEHNRPVTFFTGTDVTFFHEDGQDMVQVRKDGHVVEEFALSEYDEVKVEVVG